jgi:hypothetical protein
MANKPTYKDLQHKIAKLEREVRESVSRERACSEKQKRVEYSHRRRVRNLMNLNDALDREIRILGN